MLLRQLRYKIFATKLSYFVATDKIAQLFRFVNTPISQIFMSILTNFVSLLKAHRLKHLKILFGTIRLHLTPAIQPAGGGLFGVFNLGLMTENRLNLGVNVVRNIKADIRLRMAEDIKLGHFVGVVAFVGHFRVEHGVVRRWEDGFQGNETGVTVVGMVNVGVANQIAIGVGTDD